MKKLTLIALLVTTSFLSAQVNGQKTCNKPKEEVLEDLNAITKCSVKSDKSSDKRQIKVRVSANRKRYLLRRNTKSASAVSAAELKSFKASKVLMEMTNSITMEEVRSAKKFTDVQKAPAFSKCKSLKGKKSIECFETQIMSHISKNFQYPSEAIKDNIQGEVWVRFVIDKNGSVKNLKTLVSAKNGNGELLDMEAQRVVSLLPKLAPATLKGKPVSVRYGFPINFSLEE